MEAQLKEIERLTILNKGYESFDTWGSDKNAMLYFWLIENFIKKGFNSFSGENGQYVVYFREGHSGKGGMDMGSPDSVIIQEINKYKEV